MALGAALYAPLHLLEVALRNALHDALTQHYGANIRWYSLPDAFPPKLRGIRNGPVDQVAAGLQKVSKITAPHLPDAPGRLVAMLTFGFWTSLLTAEYGKSPPGRSPWQPIWPQLLSVAFPNFVLPAGATQGRQVIAERFDNIRQLRNRISHHEPIWRGRPIQRTGRRASLPNEYQEILEAVGWISPELLSAVKAVSTFPQIHQNGPVPYRAILAALP